MGYQKDLSLGQKAQDIWIYTALFFNIVPFQLHTFVPSSLPVIDTRSVKSTSWSPNQPSTALFSLSSSLKSPALKVFYSTGKTLKDPWVEGLTNRVGKEKATLAHSFHRNSAGLDLRVVLVKQNTTMDFPAVFLFDGLANLLH